MCVCVCGYACGAAAVCVARTLEMACGAKVAVVSHVTIGPLELRRRGEP